jgi:hypothetical protein
MCKPWKRQGSCIGHRAKHSDIKRMQQFKCEAA